MNKLIDVFMRKDLYISILFSFIGYSTLYSQDTDVKITQDYQRIDHLKTLSIDSLSMTRGIDFERGSSVDKKKYKIFKKNKNIIKIEYDEINDGYGPWDTKTTIYLRHNIPFYITENTNGTVTEFTSTGEKSERYKLLEQIYVYDLNSEKIKKLRNGLKEEPQIKICKECYEKLIEEIKLAFKSKN